MKKAVCWNWEGFIFVKENQFQILSLLNAWTLSLCRFLDLKYYWVVLTSIYKMHFCWWAWPLIFCLALLLYYFCRQIVGLCESMFLGNRALLYLKVAPIRLLGRSWKLWIALFYFNYNNTNAILNTDLLLEEIFWWNSNSL